MLSEQGVPARHAAGKHALTVVLRFSATFWPLKEVTLSQCRVVEICTRGWRAIGWGLSWRGSSTTFPLNWTRMPRLPCGTVAALEGRRGGRSQSACLRPVRGLSLPRFAMCVTYRGPARPSSRMSRVGDPRVTPYP